MNSSIKCLQLLPYLWLQRYFINNSSFGLLLNCPNKLSNQFNLLSSPSSCFASSASPPSSTSDLKLKQLSKTMENIKEVNIDPKGKFKYIQIKVRDDEGNEKLIVRGYRDCGYHADILDRVQSQLRKYRCECPGGGRIIHEPEKKKLFVYGYSMGFGKADHQLTVDLLKKAYPDYTVDWSDEGY